VTVRAIRASAWGGAIGLAPLMVLAVACGGASGANVEPAVIPEAPVEVAAPSGPFRGYVPEGYDYRVYGDFEAIRRCTALAGARDELHAWFRDRRPDVRAVFDAPGLHPLEHATRGVLVEQPGWEWIFTIDYPSSRARIERSLESAVTAPWVEEGSFRVAPIRGFEPPALVAHPHDGRLVITTPLSMAPASRVEPVEIDFHEASAVVSFDAPRSEGGIFGIALFHGNPLRLTAHLFDRGDRLEVVAHTLYSSSAEAADAALDLQQLVRQYAENPLVRMTGLDAVLGRVRVEVDGSEIVLAVALTGTEATLLARLALDAIDLPDGM
jgi:hypothetical protein